jgi:F-type H+-transporting ATPase subunit b
VTVDWITVSAQIVNFLILVWLLKRFLYQPVIRAMDRREQRIAEQLEQARQREHQAQQQQQQYQEKANDLDQQREDILSKAKENAEQQKHELMDQAREEVSDIRKQWQQQVEQEKQAFLKNLRSKSAGAIQAIGRKALSELANVELEEQVISSFLLRLKSLDHNTRKALTQALQESSEPLRIHTAFELDPAVRGRITRAVHEHIVEGIETEYFESEQLLCGIELNAGAQRISWSLADYLDGLGKQVEDAFASTSSSNR